MEQTFSVRSVLRSHYKKLSQISWSKTATRIHRRKLLKIGHDLLYWAWSDVLCVYIHVQCKYIVHCILQKTDPSSRQRGAPHQQTCKCLTEIKICSQVPNGGLTPTQTGRLTVGHDITLTLTLIFQFGNPEEGERPPLEAATKQRLVKTKNT
jgi:hypothetical protein